VRYSIAADENSKSKEKKFFFERFNLKKLSIIFDILYVFNNENFVFVNNFSDKFKSQKSSI